MEHRYAIIAALPREIAALVKGTKPDATLRAQGIWCYRLPGAVVIAAGMGRDRAALAVSTALRETSADITLISTGLAGACTASLSPGGVIECGVVIDANTGERFATTATSASVLVSTDVIASVPEKVRLAASYGASLVDMEAATVARLAAAHGVKFRAIKAISDAHTFELEPLSRFTGPRGEFRTAAFALHTALRPWLWAKAATLGRHSGLALAKLNDRLRAEIAKR